MNIETAKKASKLLIIKSGLVEDLVLLEEKDIFVSYKSPVSCYDHHLNISNITDANTKIRFYCIELVKEELEKIDKQLNELKC